MTQTYMVTWGDTLGAIAKRHHVELDELARANDIRDPDRIYVGQHLTIPTKRPEWNRVAQPCILTCKIVDPNWRPIPNLRTRLVVDGHDVVHTTGADGSLPPVEVKQINRPVTVFVAKLTGGEKQVASLTPEPGKHAVTVISPTVKIETKLRPHVGPARPSLLDALIKSDEAATHPVEELFAKPNLAPGPTAPQRNDKGHPVEAVILQCPNPYNLNLGPNYIYGNAILSASRRSGIQPQAIAALIDAEAGRDKNGVWNRYAANANSTARGMTQFIRGTWLSEALRPGTYLHEYALSKGLISHQPGKGMCLALANGKHPNRRDVETHKTEWIEHDEIGKVLLDLRKDPMFAINAAVDYGLANLKTLSGMGFNLAGLNDGEKAKILYLTHHLGVGDAKRFIRNTITEEDQYGSNGKLIRRGARSLLIAQIGMKSAEGRASDFDDSYVVAHRRWLSDYIDKKITLGGFACDVSSVINTRDTLSIVEKL